MTYEVSGWDGGIVSTAHYSSSNRDFNPQQKLVFNLPTPRGGGRMSFIHEIAASGSWTRTSGVRGEWTTTRPPAVSLSLSLSLGLGLEWLPMPDYQGRCLRPDPRVTMPEADFCIDVLTFRDCRKLNVSSYKPKKQNKNRQAIATIGDRSN